MNDKIQLAAMGEHLAEQQPMCMAKRIEELEAQVRVMADLLRDLRPDIELHLHNSTVMKSDKGIDRCNKRLKRIDAALAGKMSNHAEQTFAMVPEWCEELAEAGLEALEERGFRVGASDFGKDDLMAMFYAMLAAATKPEAK